MEQLLALKPLMEETDGFIVTERVGYESKLPVRAYYLKQVNRREASFVPRMLANAATSVRILVRERPAAIVCTGVLATIPLCLLGKLSGARLVYIESFAKTDSPTLTGKLLYKFADRFYVQWESMLRVYPGAVFVGGVY